MTRDEIAKLSGRELDAAVAERVFKIRPLSIGCDGSKTAPFYSQSNCRGLAEMIAKTRELGYHVTIRTIRTREEGLRVWLNRDREKDFTAFGSTLPEAFARALLMTTIPPEAS